MKIEESNKLIAEFMGYEYIPYSPNSKSIPGYWLNSYSKENPLMVSWMKKNGYLCRRHKDLQYCTSWDWLMPVVEKIESLKINGKYFIPYIDIRGSNCTIYKKVRHGLPEPWFRASDITPSGNKIQGVYITILEFIKWYNDQEESI